LLVIVGGAVLGYFLWYKPSHDASAAADAPSSVGSAEGAVPVDTVDAAPAKSDRSAAIERATNVLRGYLESGTTRVRREAATALARTKDPRALDVVRSLLDAASRRSATNESQINSDQTEKLELARVLARAGDRDGLDVLVKSLNTQYSREVRVEAGRQLAKLGDRRAISPLSQLMTIKTYKIGAAEQLAIMRDPDGLAILDAIRADKDSSADDKARATVALGMSGRGDMIPELEKLLAAGEFQTQAAIALASLGKETARPKLVELLGVSALRLTAAAALRTLAPARDLSEHLPPLEQAMTAAKDIEQINAAETILVLVGDPAWSAGI
jgi:HEAT repeat protein